MNNFFVLRKKERHKETLVTAKYTEIKLPEDASRFAIKKKLKGMGWE